MWALHSRSDIDRGGSGYVTAALSTDAALPEAVDKVGPTADGLENLAA